MNTIVIIQNGPANEPAAKPQRVAETEDSVDRVARDLLTGMPYVRARPGYQKVTTEMIRKELEDFP